MLRTTLALLVLCAVAAVAGTAVTGLFWVSLAAAAGVLVFGAVALSLAGRSGTGPAEDGADVRPLVPRPRRAAPPAGNRAGGLGRAA